MEQQEYDNYHDEQRKFKSDKDQQQGFPKLIFMTPELANYNSNYTHNFNNDNQTTKLMLKQ